MWVKNVIWGEKKFESQIKMIKNVKGIIIRNISNFPVHKIYFKSILSYNSL